VVLAIAILLLLAVLAVIGYRIVDAGRSSSASDPTAVKWVGPQRLPVDRAAQMDVEEQLLRARMDEDAAKMEEMRREKEDARFEREERVRRDRILELEERVRRDEILQLEERVRRHEILQLEERRLRDAIAALPVPEKAAALPRTLIAVAPRENPLEPLELPRSKPSERVLKKESERVDDANVVVIDVDVETQALGDRPIVCWDAAGKSFYCLEFNGMLRRVALDGLKESRTLDIDSRCGSLALSAEGLVVFVEARHEVWVIDAESLDVKQRISVRPSRPVYSVLASPIQSLAYAVGSETQREGDRTRFSALDLRTGTVVSEYEDTGSHWPKRDENAASPDGKYLFRRHESRLQRIAIRGTDLIVEESSNAITYPAPDIEVSSDSRWVAIRSQTDDGADFLTHIYAVGDLKKPLCTIKRAEFPGAVGFDPRTGRIYSGDIRHTLQVFTATGKMEKEYDFGKRRGHPFGLVAHPAGNKMLVVTDENLLLVELDAAQEP
jgi:hypothetical protein